MPWRQKVILLSKFRGKRKRVSLVKDRETLVNTSLKITKRIVRIVVSEEYVVVRVDLIKSEALTVILVEI